jgi:hypothetical protein
MIHTVIHSLWNKGAGTAREAVGGQSVRGPAVARGKSGDVGLGRGGSPTERTIRGHRRADANSPTVPRQGAVHRFSDVADRRPGGSV